MSTDGARAITWVRGEGDRAARQRGGRKDDSTIHAEDAWGQDLRARVRALLSGVRYRQSVTVCVREYSRSYILRSTSPRSADACAACQNEQVGGRPRCCRRRCAARWRRCGHTRGISRRRWVSPFPLVERTSSPVSMSSSRACPWRKACEADRQTARRACGQALPAALSRASCFTETIHGSLYDPRLTEACLLPTSRHRSAPPLLASPGSVLVTRQCTRPCARPCAATLG